MSALIVNSTSERIAYWNHVAISAFARTYLQRLGAGKISQRSIQRSSTLVVLSFAEVSTDGSLQFGATITGLNLDDISGTLLPGPVGGQATHTHPELLDTDVKHLKDAIWTHKVVVVRGQKDLSPKKQWELVTRFDPEAPQVHSHGDIKTFQSKGGMLSRNREVHGIPGAENVRLIGKGWQGEVCHRLLQRSMSDR
jgi:hypothetical protein